MNKQKIKKEISKILDPGIVKGLVDDFNGQANRQALILRFNKKNRRLFWEDLSKAIEINDVIEVESDGYVFKAVVTAKGRSGVTARDRSQKQIRTYYKDIINYEKRK